MITKIDRTKREPPPGRTYLHPGELWSCVEGGTAVVVAGNCVRQDGRLWCMDWLTGKTVFLPVSSLAEHPDRDSLGDVEIQSRFHQWAKDGSSDAAWWLSWWYDGTFPARSIWYFVAALRRDRRGLLDMMDVTFTNAMYGVGVTWPPPMWDMRFLRDVPEFLSPRHLSDDWTTAIECAAAATNLMADKEQVADAIGFLNCRPRSPFARLFFESNRSFLRSNMSAKAAAYAAGITELGLSTHQRYQRWRTLTSENESAHADAYDAGYKADSSSTCPFPHRSRLAASWRRGRQAEHHDLTFAQGYHADVNAQCPYRSRTRDANRWLQGRAERVLAETDPERDVQL